MNHSHQHIKMYAGMVAGMNGQNGVNAAKLFAKFIEKSEEFSGVNWAESKRLAEKYQCKIKECFDNCSRIVLALEPGLIYCEGYACAIIPTEHAWLVNAKGEVIDPTYSLKENNCADYYGIRLTVKNILNRENVWEPTWLNAVK